MRPGDSVLLNYWYSPNVGHVIEALRYCLGYHRADPSLHISLLLHGEASFELAAMVPFVEATYGVDFSPWRGDRDPAAALRAVPRDWDYVIDNHRRNLPTQQEMVGSYFAASDVHLHAAKGRSITGRPPLIYSRHQQLRLALPDTARAEVASGRPRITVLVAGSGEAERYPSIDSWVLILAAMAERYPEGRLCLTGRLGGEGGTHTAVARSDVDRLLAALPTAVDCFDWPLVRQLALVQSSDLFLSPHTGFGMAAVCTGTPWLELGGDCLVTGQYLFNGVPFHWLVPDLERFPMDGRLVPDGDAERYPGMSSERIRVDRSRIVAAAGELIEGRVTYHDCLRRHFRDLVRVHGGDVSRVWSFDNVHRFFIGPGPEALG